MILLLTWFVAICAEDLAVPKTANDTTQTTPTKQTLQASPTPPTPTTTTTSSPTTVPPKPTTTQSPGIAGVTTEISSSAQSIEVAAKGMIALTAYSLFGKWIYA